MGVEVVVITIPILFLMEILVVLVVVLEVLLQELVEVEIPHQYHHHKVIMADLLHQLARAAVVVELGEQVQQLLHHQAPMFQEGQELHQQLVVLT